MNNNNNKPDNTASKAEIEDNDGVDEWRNLSPMMLKQIVYEISKNNISIVILMGDLEDKEEIENLKKEFPRITFCNMCDFYKNEEFLDIVGINSMAGQIYFHYILHEKFAVKFLVGMMSGALDGPAFIGIPTLFFTYGDSRMINASECIPCLKPIKYDKDRVRDQFNLNPNNTKFAKTELENFSKEVQLIISAQNNTEIYDTTINNNISVRCAYSSQNDQ